MRWFFLAFFEGSIYSNKLKMSTSISVSLPHDLSKKPENGFPVLYLLHGLFDNHSDFARNTNIDRCAGERGIAVIMPEVQKSYYTDMVYGLDYFSYVSDELPKLCREMFGLSKRREDTFAAGISMGGYGALKCALKRPDVFSACAGISGAIDMERRALDCKSRPEMRCAFGDPAIFSKDNDIFELAKSIAQNNLKQRFYICCGTDDSMLAESRRFKEKLNELNIELTYKESRGGHEWAYWDSVLPQVLDFFTERI